MAEEGVFELLAAPAARPAAEEGLDLYEGLIGSWDIVSTWFRGGAAVSSRRGQWHFARILGGRGVQDILFAEGAPPEERGTTLRCYDASIKAWRVAWMMPSSGEFAQLVGRREGGRIVQEGAGAEPGGRLRWSFASLEPGSFLWLGELSRDGGATWELEQEMRASRRPEAGPAAGGSSRDNSSL